ncbi:hypothetical protein AVEN_84947-1 [Araneus ventricosus]|uniref:Uncharacterized protein n=1 Tax=Araneus ventricosus TaxID=182803 RepID=A0A4Y2BZB5_ARAVE|nr:hypothetical protein AVEN_84947-1 [Araneus ventricosus]
MRSSLSVYKSSEQLAVTLHTGTSTQVVLYRKLDSSRLFASILIVLIWIMMRRLSMNNWKSQSSCNGACRLNFLPKDDREILSNEFEWFLDAEMDFP